MVVRSIQGAIARGRQLYLARILCRLNTFSGTEPCSSSTEDCLSPAAADLWNDVKGRQKLSALEERSYSGPWNVRRGFSNILLAQLSSELPFPPLCRPLALHLSAAATSSVNSTLPASPSTVEIATDLLKPVREENSTHIGYRSLGGLDPSAAPLKLVKKPVFAVVQVGSHQFKVTPGDSIYVEKLLYADVNEKLALDKVLLVGSRHQTIIGRPVVPGAYVVALLEEHMLDGKVIIFKKKRRKNYRRTRGHRQELTRLRILEVVGIEEEPTVDGAEEINSQKEAVQVVEAAGA